MWNLIISVGILALTLSVHLVPIVRRRKQKPIAAAGEQEPVLVDLTQAAMLLNLVHAGQSLEALLVHSGVRAEIDPDGYLKFHAVDVIALKRGDIEMRLPHTNR